MKKFELKQMVREEIQAALSEANVAKPYAVIDVSQKGDPIVSAAFESEIAAKKFAKLTNLKKPNTNHVVKKLKVQVEPGQKIGRAYAFRSLTVESELSQLVREIVLNEWTDWKDMSKADQLAMMKKIALNKKNKSAGGGTNLECMECGKKFKKSNPTSNTKCPKCGGYDIDIAY